MASASGRNSSGKKNLPAKSTASRGKSSGKKTTAAAPKRKVDYEQAVKDSALYHEISLIILFVAMVFLFFCNFGVIGAVGNAISKVMFGLFGFTAYVAPILLFLALAFWYANQGSPTAIRKMIAAGVLFLMVGIICELFADNTKVMAKYSAKTIYAYCSTYRKGGGIFAGSLAYLLHHNLETIGTILIVILLSIISIILLTERSILDSMKNGGERLREKTREDAEFRREIAQRRREEQLTVRESREEERRLREQEKEDERRMRAEAKENEKILRMDKKVTGVSVDTELKNEKVNGRLRGKKNDVHEIVYVEEPDGDLAATKGKGNAYGMPANNTKTAGNVHEIHTEQPYQGIPEPKVAGRRAEAAETVRPATEMSYVNHQGAPVTATAPVAGHVSAMAAMQAQDDEILEAKKRMESQFQRDQYARNAESGRERFQQKEGGVPLPREAEKIQVHSGGQSAGNGIGASGYQNPTPVRKTPAGADGASADLQTAKELSAPPKKVPKTYMFPPLSRLQKGAASTNDNSAELKETALRLRDTLHTFGVNVTITDISQGPSVTRYELQPEQGVKVSKIVGLADDIKLNLAATDIRIEAPIPGKAAIGIEVPNKENMMVALRDLLESKQFQEFDSKLAFAVGKDIAGQTVVADIAKMPHMLIAGSTGSGKSVCINTLIMSILYKAHPDDVKLIMVDPKVVELSVYNGIPHLLIPVVTDPKKASAALHWAVSEMEDRYRKFADFNVRDLKGYNKKIESMQDNGDGMVPNKLPQIVIIVDELADLMMVSPGEVEESICRLAQLARACGIHLIIATQRPSVDVITGLIKANMPSRVAFAVSSGVDSRTILDMVGAEKLLGKGDMLFYPQGYSKPARIQGAFVSDKEVSDVVDFLKNQMIGNTYAEDIEEKIKNMGNGNSSSGGGSSSGSNSGLDEYFEEAGRFVIENMDKNKASVGSLQRLLKIGFNRAARIMDQLCEYGVVGESEGTKARKVLMTMEEFEQLLETL
ncbi:MAG: DNA translocase FtsK [Lachnospiraceae bacterium]|jgi:S-DNA-T family DNA segregation ATPase FtsK/SpoIIIE|nr:DNA translocase FtsK [Lachnospiraceae bacterium]